MKNKSVTLLLLFTVFLLLAWGITRLGSQARLDLTQQQLYTLSQGTRNIITALDYPVTLELYFSAGASADLNRLRAYAQRVEEFLHEYEMLSAGRLTVRVIDPEPFSEAEDQAAAYGLQAVPVGNGDSLYFGLVAKAEVADRGTAEQQPTPTPAATRENTATLAFLQPDREAFLEYDITQLIDQVQQTDPPVIGLISGLDVRGGFDPRTGQPSPAWMSLDQLDGPYELRSIAANTAQIDDDVDILMLVQPPEMTDATLYAIDQFAMRGGRIMAFIDPLAENAPAPGMMGMADQGSADSLNRLLSAWGVQWDSSQVVLDAAHGIVVSQGQGRPPVRHFGLLALDKGSMRDGDVVTAPLETVNVSSSGYFTAAEDATTVITPWLISSTDSALTGAQRMRMGGDLMELQRDFVPSGKQYALAVRVTGSADSAFADGPPAVEAGDAAAAEAVAQRQSTDQLAVTLVADTDVLSDRLWVQVQNFFGQRIASPWADNGALLVNLADNLSGSADLISLRARGQYSRPFTRVDEIQRLAEQRFLASEKRLQQQLQDTEQQLAELQQQRDEDGGVLTLSAEQQQALERFRQQKVEIRKELRNVQHELDKDIDALGTRLKVINIFVLPLLLTLLLGAFAWWRRRTQHL